MSNKTYAFVNDNFLTITPGVEKYKRDLTLNVTSLAYPSVGFLPPCVRYISPYFEATPGFHAIFIIENTPREINGVHLGWHSFIITVDKLKFIKNAQIVFTDTSIQGSDTQLYIPYLPNVDIDEGKLGEYTSGFAQVSDQSLFDSRFFEFYSSRRNEILQRCFTSTAGRCAEIWKDIEGPLDEMKKYQMSDVASGHFFSERSIPSITIDDIFSYVRARIKSEVLIK